MNKTSLVFSIVLILVAYLSLHNNLFARGHNDLDHDNIGNIPSVDFDEIIFCRYDKGRGHISGREKGSKGGLYKLSGIQSGHHQITDILEHSVFENGTYEGMAFSSFSRSYLPAFEINYDATQIAFAWTPRIGKSPYGMSNWQTNEWDPALVSAVLQIFTVNIDGTNLRQVTSGARHHNFPTWLPNGRIAFVRAQTITTRCAGGQDHVINGYKSGLGNTNSLGFNDQTILFSIKPDGTDLIQLSWHETAELHPSVDNNGRIVYTRWDYIDRDFSAGHHMWICNPDGTDPRSPSGNYFLWSEFMGYKGNDGRKERPWAQYWIKAIPGTYGKYTAIAGIHHAAAFGPPIIIDITIEDDYKDAQITKIFPEYKYPSEQPESFEPHGFYYAPWPLDEDYMITSKLPKPVYINEWKAYNKVHNIGGTWREQYQDQSNKMALYLLNMKTGDEELINHCDVPRGGIYMISQPLRPRPVPVILPTTTYQGERRNSPRHKRATISILDVYNSDLPFPEEVVVNRRIKELRVIQLIPKGPGGKSDHPKISWSDGALARAVLGTVPVEEDGSVYMEAPVERGLYFQVLDENGYAVQSMRSLTYVHPGEQLSCIGCHENKWKAPNVSTTMPLAFKRPPSPITPEPEGSHPVSFGNLVKPVFENTCRSCHMKQKVKLKDFSYVKLEPYVWYYKQGGGGGNRGQSSRSIPGEIGAHASLMGQALLNGPCKSGITPEEKRRVSLWLDLGAPRLGSFSTIPVERDRQEAGGEPVWSWHLDPNNVTGVEYDRPIP